MSARSLKTFFSISIASAIASLVLLLTGCGYKMGASELDYQNATIEVPYAIGDYAGCFTQELIKALTYSSDFTYTTRSGHYTLLVTLDCVKTNPIGFRYEQSYEGVYGKRLVASEAQLTLRASVCLKDKARQIPLIDPFYVTEMIEFDFEPETSLQNQTGFSMGQLDFENPSRDAALLPLYQKLSKKIVDYLNASL